MNTQSIRRSALAVLLVTPLSVLAQAAPADKAASPTPPAHPDPRFGKLEYKLTSEQLQAVMNPTPKPATEIKSDTPLSDVVVRGGDQAEKKSPIAVRPCGLMSVMWFIEHPADGWRMFTPIATDGELNVCLKPPLTAASPAFVPTNSQ